MKALPRSLMWTLVPPVVLVVLHEGLLRWMADKNIVAVLLSGGNQASTSTVVAAVAFVILRFLVICILPGWVVWRLTVLGILTHRARNAVHQATADSRDPLRTL